MASSATNENIRRATAGEVELAYETFGDPADPPVLLVMGFATQMLGWPDGFCEALAARGHHVIRFDNRDIGLSTHLHDAGPADIQAILAGDTSTAAYRLTDMAADTVGLLDALGIDRVHLVGASMGGMIAQTVAIEHPARVRSLTSIMSTTGDQRVGAPTQEAIGVLLAPPATSREESMDRAVAAYKVIGSPGYPLDEAALRERAGLSYDRAYDPAGVSRQLAAIWVSGDRTQGLAGVQAPTLVIHGAEDSLVNVSGGRATAAAIPGSELLLIDGMGHDLPPALFETYVSAIRRVADRAV